MKNHIPLSISLSILIAAFASAGFCGKTDDSSVKDDGDDSTVRSLSREPLGPPDEADLTGKAVVGEYKGPVVSKKSWHTGVRSSIAYLQTSHSIERPIEFGVDWSKRGMWFFLPDIMAVDGYLHEFGFHVKFHGKDGSYKGEDYVMTRPLYGSRTSVTLDRLRDLPPYVTDSDTVHAAPCLRYVRYHA